MKKIILVLFTALITTFSYAQPVADNAIIPIAVSLNSILRLNITSGGNMEFVLNSLRQYETGIANSSKYTTQFTVASSIDFDIDLYAEGATMAGSDDATGTNTLDVNNVGYIVAYTSADHTVDTDLSILGDTDGDGISNSVQILDATAAEIVSAISSATTGNAGDVNANIFDIRWEFATSDVQTAATLGTLLEQNIVPDRYSTNVFISLKPAN